MTIPVNVAKLRLTYPGDTAPIGLAGGGGALYFQSPSHLAVTLVAADGTVIPLTYGADYTIGGDGLSGAGTITLTAALAAGVLTVRRATPSIQQATWSEGDGNPSARFESTSDYGRLIDQEIAESESRALIAPDYDPPLDMTLDRAAVRAGHLFGFAAGTGAPATSSVTLAQLDGLASTFAVVEAAAGLLSSWVAAGGSAPIDVDPFFAFNPNPDSPATGNAQFLFTPTLSTTNSDAVFVYPKIGTFTDSGSFAAAYNLKWGDTGTEIPAGTQVCLGGYEANITTNQTFDDTSGGGGIHLFGGTFELNGGTEAQGIALTATINTVASTYYGADININNNCDGGHTVGYTASSNGTHAALTAFELTGNWTNAFDAALKPMINVQEFDTTTHFQFNGGPAYFDFNSSGVLPDTTLGVGLALTYNYLGGSREVDFWNMDDGGASASFLFQQMNNDGTATTVGLLSKTVTQFPGELQPGGAIKLANAYVGTPISPTGYVTLKDSTGTTYKVAVST